MELRERIKRAINEVTMPCVMVSAKSCLGTNTMNTDLTKCATLDGTPVTLQDMHKVVTFGNNPETYRIFGIQFNPMGNGSDDMNSSNKACGCDPDSWQGWGNWIDTWTNNIAFQNPNNNPNQPCNHICQRKQLWSGQVLNVGPVWANKLYCKLQTVEEQIQLHGCNC